MLIVTSMVNLAGLMMADIIRLSVSWQHCDDQRAVAKFSKSQVSVKVLEKKYLIFGDTQISL